MPTIVHFDDDPWIAQEVEKACSEAGVKHVWFDEPPDNLVAAVCKHAPNAVLSDLNMPRRNGITVVRLLRADPRTRSLPVALYTTMRSDDVRTQAFAAGATELFTKSSTSPEEVVRYLVSVIGQTDMRA